MSKLGPACSECGSQSPPLQGWYLGKTQIDAESGNKIIEKYCSLECAVFYLLRKDASGYGE